MKKQIVAAALAAVLSVGSVAVPVSVVPVGIVAEAATEAKLSAPENITGKVSKNSIVLTWDKVEGADAYRVYIYNAETKKYEKYKTVSGTKCTVKELENGKTYYFKVATMTKSGKKYVRNEISSKVSVKMKANKSDTSSKKPKKTKTEKSTSWNDIASYGFTVSNKLDTGNVNYENNNSDAVDQFNKFIEHLKKDCNITYSITSQRIPGLLEMELGELKDADGNVIADVTIFYDKNQVTVMGVPEK